VCNEHSSSDWIKRNRKGIKSEGYSGIAEFLKIFLKASPDWVQKIVKIKNKRNKKYANSDLNFHSFFSCFLSAELCQLERLGCVQLVEFIISFIIQGFF